MPDRRIGQLETREKIRREVVRVYRDAWRGAIKWADALPAAVVLAQLFNMIAANGDDEHREAQWKNVGQNALHRRKAK